MSGWITPYSDAQLDELMKSKRKKKMLLRIDAATPILIVSGDEHFTHDAEEYVPKEWSYKDLETGSGATASIENVSKEMSIAKFTEGSFGGLEVLIILYLMKDDGTWLEIAERVFQGRNCAWDLKTFRVRMKEEGAVRRKGSLQKATAHCDLPFKGTLCAYASSDTRCLKTWVDCKSKSNTANFRGFRFIPPPGQRLNLDYDRYVYVPGGNTEFIPTVSTPTAPSYTPTPEIRRGGRRVTTNLPGYEESDDSGRPPPRRVGR